MRTDLVYIYRYTTGFKGLNKPISKTRIFINYVNLKVTGTFLLFCYHLELNKLNFSMSSPTADRRSWQQDRLSLIDWWWGEGDVYACDCVFGRSNFCLCLSSPVSPSLSPAVIRLLLSYYPHQKRKRLLMMRIGNTGRPNTGNIVVCI